MRCRSTGEDSIAEAPSFASYLSNIMVRAGQKLKLECRVAGKPFPDLAWFHNEKQLRGEMPNVKVICDLS